MVMRGVYAGITLLPDSRMKRQLLVVAYPASMAPPAKNRAFIDLAREQRERR